MKKDGNIQIFYTQESYPYLLIKWQKEQIEVGLTKDYKITHVKGPSFEFNSNQDGELNQFEGTRNEITRTWEKNKAGEWIKQNTVVNTPNLYAMILKSDYGDVLEYSKKCKFATIDVVYELNAPEADAWFIPEDYRMLKWIKILNPHVKRIREKEFKIKIKNFEPAGKKNKRKRI